MSQQGGRPTGQDDDWWRQLYDDSTDDTGPTPAPDSLDDRFASAAGAVGSPADERPASDPVVPAPRAAADEPRAPWEPPTSRPPRPSTFPTATKPPGGTGQTPDRPPPPSPPPPPPLPTTPPSWPSPEFRPAEPTFPAAEPGGVGSPGAGSGGAGAPGSGSGGTSTPVAESGRTGAPATGPGRAGFPATEPDGTAFPAPVDPPPAPPRSAEGPPVPPSPADAPPAPSRSAEGPPAPPRPADAPSAPPRPAERPPLPPSPADAPSAPPRPADPAFAPPLPVTPPPPPQTLSDQPAPRIERPEPSPLPLGYVGSRPPTYDAEPIALPAADPDDLDDLVADTVLDGARYGACTLRAVSVRGDSARYRGEPRRDSLLTARFGTGEHALLLVAMATGARATQGAHRAAAEACHWIGRAVGRSHARLVADIRDGRRGDLKSGLHRLTDRSLGKLRASAAEQGVDPQEYAAGLRCLLLSADPECRTRVFFGVGPGGLFRLRDGEWQDIEPQVAEIKGEPVMGFGSPPSETPEGDRFTMDLGIPTPPSPYEPAPEPPREPFRFRTSVARPGDTLLLCSGGLADPLRGEPELGDYLAERWSRPDPPGLAAFLADSQVRVKGYADDRTAAAVWEA
ncbi:MULTISPECIES: protein phosphatase 2C domain-containing protein [Streptomyces]|uniref:Protein phosphatase 2C domain-containing protein n=1 Tax=Streptomyces koelreuteriae TaxID=2838015 RepID=A0ABX8FM53_9ACTN|nr:MULTISPECIES: protein phosphatase 2C domain-containing protein [Streptomyces]QWB22238.1 protein phosphatase 2C domain-containing protein [Streptomyces koelreuteriae]UUA05179.1 protein phosphatase 2C domain-containing protein [Streptomyces koelreuteriae]UUA12804.1 protein phosphatase 2C domain-containing protein [Streptomyces sp. CRCS-T-1]